MADVKTSDAVVGLDESLMVMRRHWKVLVGATAVGLLLGIASLLAQSDSFSSDSLVEVRPLISQGDSPNLDVTRQVNTTTEQSIASSQRVVERALALLAAGAEPSLTNFDDPAINEQAAEIVVDGEEARRVQQQITVTVEDQAEVLRIEAEAGSAARAQDLAQAVAHAYLDFREEAATSATSVARDRLLEREQQLLAELDIIAGNIVDQEQALANAAQPLDPAFPSILAPQVRPAALRSLEAEEIAKRTNLQGIGSRLANIDAITINVGEILDDADLPARPAGVPAVVGPLAGLLLGLGVGVGTAFALDRSDATVRDALNELPAMGADILGFSPANNLIAVTEGTNLQVDDAYRRTQAALLFKMDRADQQVVLVAGTNDIHRSEAAAMAAANLAVAAARVGRKTLLVLADLRDPGIHERLDVTNHKGLSEVIAGKAGVTEVTQAVPELTSLFVITPGADLTQPTRLLQSSNVGRLLEKSRSNYELVVVAAPALTDYADAVVLAPMCDTAILIVEPTQTRRADVVSSVRQLTAVGLEVAGSIVAQPIAPKANR
ncbi:MAG: CpsD/CapB family tyrosine-protein kinase [Acidimicrobiales bacterium]|nr:CpsD/CapB family tyrosine-protein kinase [Acidimicrobiales bacterium]